LAFEVLHNIKEAIVYIWLVGKLDLNLIQVAEGILFAIH